MEDFIDNETDRFFRDSLQHSTNIPRNKVWIEIQKQLDAENKRYVAGLYKRKYTVGPALMLCVILGLSVWFYSRGREGGKGLVERSSFAKMNPPGLINQNLQKVKSGALSERRTAIEPIIQTNSFFGRNKVPFKYSIFNKIPAGEIQPIPSEIQPVLSEIQPIHSENQPLLSQNQPVLSEIQPVLLANVSSRSNSVVRLKDGYKRFTAAVFGSKEFAGYTFSDNDIMGANGKEIEKRERNVFSAAVGIHVNYRFNRRWAIQSGIAYSWSNSRIDSATSYAVQEGNGPAQFKFNSVLGYSYLHPHGSVAPAAGDSVLTAKSSTNLHYVTIPLAVSYRISAKRFAFVPAVGITLGILTKAEMEANEYGMGYDEKESKIPIRGLKKINIGVLLKADIEYKISNFWAVEIIPSFRSTLSPVNLKSALSVYPYNFGIGTGLQFSF